jgi:hypothetical protein
MWVPLIILVLATSAIAQQKTTVGKCTVAPAFKTCSAYDQTVAAIDKTYSSAGEFFR